MTAVHEIENPIAYLAPEIPALSATFVYNEILALETMGFTIVPLSVHVPAARATEGQLQDLAARTDYLYQRSLFKILGQNIEMMIKQPGRYLKTLGTAIGDALRVGITTRVGLGLLYRFGMAACVAAELVRQRCRHLHAHFAHVPTDIAMYAARMAGISFSFTAHANDLFERGWLLAEKVGRARFAATISQFNRQFMIAQGADGSKIQVVHCGVDAGAFEPREAKALEATPLIGTLGRMVEKKGFDVLVSACKILIDRGQAFHLTIAGNGPLRKAITDRIHELNLASAVSLPGALPHAAVPDWLRRLDLFVLPCRQDRRGDMDGIPVVLMEAMLSGVPVISTQLSGIPELVVDDQTGCLVLPDDPQALATAMMRLLTDHGLRTRLVQQAAHKVRVEFDLFQNAQTLSKLFQGALTWPQSNDVM